MFDKHHAAGADAGATVGESAGVPGETGPGWPEPSSAADLTGLRRVLAGMTPASEEAEAVDRIRVLEELKSTCAALQAQESVALDVTRRAGEQAQGVPAAERGRGVAAEVALARRDSPSRGSRYLGLAKALVREMPHTLAALTDGRLSEEKATVLCKETAWLPVEARREVDRLMADRCGQVGVRRLASEARAHAQRLDQAAAVAHLERAANERHVSVRPTPGGMAYLSALVPMAQAVAAYAGLHRDAANAVGSGQAEGRGQGQVMADLLIERLTGQTSVAAIPVEIQLVMTDRSLLAGDRTAAWLPGHGPVPAETARDLVRDSKAEVFIRRLYTHPETGQLVGMDQRSRVFTGLLRRMVVLREDTCRTPWCDAPIRHVDHAQPHRDGGLTSWENASGLCARCNYTKERPRWTHRAGPDELKVTTPTGHHYGVQTPPLIIGARPPDPVSAEALDRYRRAGPHQSPLEQALIDHLFAA